MIRYEYKVIESADYKFSAERLTEEGLEGWELVAIVYADGLSDTRRKKRINVAYFKRPIDSHA